MQKLKLKNADVKTGSVKMAATDEGSGRRTVTTVIALGMLKLMRAHIGRKKAILKQTLFQTVYGEVYDARSYEHFAKWDYVKRALHMLRVRSNCFVVGEGTPRGWVYYVVSSELEAGTYVNAVEHNVRGLRKLQKRALVAAKQQWHTQEWRIEGLQRRWKQQ